MREPASVHSDVIVLDEEQLFMNHRCRYSTNARDSPPTANVYVFVIDI